MPKVVEKDGDKDGDSELQQADKDNSINKTAGNMRTVSILYLNANFVKDGNVTYAYKVEAQADPNFRPGFYNPEYDGLYFVEDVNLRTEKISNTYTLDM